MTMANSFKIYRIINRATGEDIEIGADSAQGACQKLGWLIGDCYVKVLVDPDTAARFLKSENEYRRLV